MIFFEGVGERASLSARAISNIEQNTVNQTITVFFISGRLAKKCIFGHLKRAKSLTYLKSEKC